MAAALGTFVVCDSRRAGAASAVRLNLGLLAAIAAGSAEVFASAPDSAGRVPVPTDSDGDAFVTLIFGTELAADGKSDDDPVTWFTGAVSAALSCASQLTNISAATTTLHAHPAAIPPDTAL